MDSTPARSIRASSGSLSSPTPSPPHRSAALPPVQVTNQPRITNKQARRTGLESGSDSSELTDEDDVKQRTKKKKKRGRKPRKLAPSTTTTVDKEQSSRRAHSRGTSESTANGTHNGSGSTSTSGSQAQSNSRSSRRSGVVVPPAMWEWAYKKPKQPANGLGLDITPRDGSPSRSHSSGPEQTKATDSVQLSDGEIEDPPATSTSEPPPRRHDKPISAAERPTISISTGLVTDDISTPISAPNTSATTPRPSPTPVQPESNSKKPSPTPDESHSAASGNADETRSDIDMPLDEPEPGELVETSKPTTRKASTAQDEPEPEPEDEPAPGDDSKASIDPEPEPEPEEEHEPEPEPEPEPGPEPEAEVEIDPDMQPPHRAEALDVLAAMEVRFAELRERLYADKMEEAAREEAMILDGTHPELLFFQRELDARRGRRKQLAETRRSLETGWCATMRRAEEAAAWSEWRHARDELRDNMRTECARKRRRLEREKRTAERPANVRPIPAAPGNLPQPPSLKSLLKLHANPQRASVPVRATPALTPLSYADAVSDLEQMTPRRTTFYQPPPINYASEEEAYARSRGYGYRSMNGAGSSSTMGPAPGTRPDVGPGPQYPPALVHSYVVGPAPAWDGSTGRRRDSRLDRERERERERDPRDARDRDPRDMRLDRERDIREPRIDRDRERDRDPRLDRERDRELPYGSPAPGASDKEDKRPASSSAMWPTTEVDHDPWDREQTREWRRRMERDQREREREGDRPLTTPFTMQPYVSLSNSVDAEMGGSSSRPLSRNVER
ncbi:unnamed protein product [Rhizoctonia solani]|uniref:Sds3-like-domain-containing protein n=1 Tax=Rhizoctonia solani TaxID=456999 RepID=A0A8H3AEI5_9AGAM|nr:unnamed protein product [Rhizoctonia solani]